MMKKIISLSVPYIAGNEWKYVKECLDTAWISSVGSFVNEFEKKVAEFAGVEYGIACMNGTSGLHIALSLSDVGAEDYVIVPNITFVASLNAIKYTGATPILIDVDQHTWQMDMDLLEKFLMEKTYNKEIDSKNYCFYKDTDKSIKAIMPVHVLGNVGNIEKLQKLANKFHIPIVEDSTESLGTYYKGKHTGSFGEMGVFSFNGNKIISTGGGGVIVTNNKLLAEKAKHLTTQAKTSPIEYHHDQIGYNYRLVNILAAIGVAQMEQLPFFLSKKRKMDRFYRNSLKGTGDIQFQQVNQDVEANNWLFTFKTAKMRELLETLNENGVQSRPFWVPMKQLPMFKDEIYITESNESKKVYETCISIPSSVGLTDEEMKIVVKQIKKFYNKQ